MEATQVDELTVVVDPTLGLSVNLPPMFGPILVGIGLLTGGTIWVLTHGHFSQKWVLGWSGS